MTETPFLDLAKKWQHVAAAILKRETQVELKSPAFQAVSLSGDRVGSVLSNQATDPIAGISKVEEE